jgi:phosphoribosyl 1,2-cyclic phosphodiesterase
MLRFRKLVTRYERHARNFLGFAKLACIVILLRQPTMEGHLRGHLVAVPRASGNGLRRPART